VRITPRCELIGIGDSFDTLRTPDRRSRLAWQHAAPFHRPVRSMRARSFEFALQCREPNSIFAQRAAHRATARANIGPNSNTRMKRAICIAITNGRSTWDEAAMIATESAPPGLVAR